MEYFVLVVTSGVSEELAASLFVVTGRKTDNRNSEWVNEEMNEWIYSYLAAGFNTWFYYMFHDNVFLDLRFALPL